METDIEVFKKKNRSSFIKKQFSLYQAVYVCLNNYMF